jgi:hypothetical protein
MQKTLLVLFLLLWQSCHSQIANYNTSTLNGVWKNTDDTTIIKFLNRGKYIDILYIKTEITIIETGNYGFCDSKKESDAIDLTDLHLNAKEGFNLCFIDNTGAALRYELEYECGNSKKDCAMLLFGQNVFKYRTIPISPFLIKFLYKQGKLDKQDYLKEYANLIVKEIAPPKCTIYQSPNVATKMYLIKGDLVSILEQKGDWVKIEYQGKKTVQGWLKKGDINKL